MGIIKQKSGKGMLFSAPESVRSSYLERCNDGFEENNIFLQKVHFWISCVFFCVVVGGWDG